MKEHFHLMKFHFTIDLLRERQKIQGNIEFILSLVATAGLQTIQPNDYANIIS